MFPLVLFLGCIKMLLINHVGFPAGREPWQVPAFDALPAPFGRGFNGHSELPISCEAEYFALGLNVRCLNDQDAGFLRRNEYEDRGGPSYLDMQAVKIMLFAQPVN